LILLPARKVEVSDEKETEKEPEKDAEGDVAMNGDGEEKPPLDRAEAGNGGASSSMTTPKKGKNKNKMARRLSPNSTRLRCEHICLPIWYHGVSKR